MNVASFCCEIYASPVLAFQLKHSRSMGRCLLPAKNVPTHFADVIFADIFTSFAKILGDIWLSSRMLLPGNSLLRMPSEDNWTRWIIPTIMR